MKPGRRMNFTVSFRTVVRVFLAVLALGSTLLGTEDPREIVVRSMMYVALSYDHRLVDGEQAVTFLVRVKERLEDPSRLLLDV